ncbi:contactin-4-like [Zonotrichia leucophrys gambelii]|uniref:contactin-4-like n=1 Tax=Zonotrichia leucophrys gambelii TaxID=257770 RepID=UPI00314041B4
MESCKGERDGGEGGTTEEGSKGVEGKGRRGERRGGERREENRRRGGGVEERRVARTLAPCYSADLRPAAGSLVSAVGCTVLLTAPALRGSRAVAWEYRAGSEEGVILTYGFRHPPNVSRLFENRATFNESNLSLQVVLQRGDSRLYRLRAQEEATAWFHLRVVEPLSPPQIVGNSLVKAGGNTKLVCRVVHGTADAYWWKKNGQPLVESERIQFVENTTLVILRVSISDSGYYTCVVSNAVSQNETSFLLKVHHSTHVVLPVVMTCVIIGLIAGVFVWCWRREKEHSDNCW